MFHSTLNGRELKPGDILEFLGGFERGNRYELIAVFDPSEGRWQSRCVHIENPKTHFMEYSYKEGDIHNIADIRPGRFRHYEDEFEAWVQQVRQYEDQTANLVGLS